MVPEAEKNLPVALPRDVQLSGKGGSPLASVASFVNATPVTIFDAVAPPPPATGTSFQA